MAWYGPCIPGNDCMGGPPGDAMMGPLFTTCGGMVGMLDCRAGWYGPAGLPSLALRMQVLSQLSIWLGCLFFVDCIILARDSCGRVASSCRVFGSGFLLLMYSSYSWMPLVHWHAWWRLFTKSEGPVEADVANTLIGSAVPGMIGDGIQGIIGGGPPNILSTTWCGKCLGSKTLQSNPRNL